MNDTSKGPGGLPDALPREDLYALVWKEPMLKIAGRFGISSSYLARVCTMLNVPRPARGYWAKLAVGKVTKVPTLPPPRPGDMLAWSRQGDVVRAPRAPPRPPLRRRRRKQLLAARPSGPHPLLEGIKAHFETARLSYEADYLKPAKRLLPDLIATKTGLEKVIGFADELYSALERREYRVVIAPHTERFHRAEVDEREHPQEPRGLNNLWCPARGTVVYIGTVALGLTIIEMSEQVPARYVNGKYVRENDYVAPKRRRGWADRSWTTTKAFPSSRLCLQVYSPYPRTAWVRRWNETKDRKLTDRLEAIVTELERAAADVARLAEEGERQAELERVRWEAQREEWRRKEAVRRTADAVANSKHELPRIIAAWSRAKRLERFFEDLERRIAQLETAEHSALLEKLKRARELTGSTDPLEQFLGWRAPDDRKS